MTYACSRDVTLFRDLFWKFAHHVVGVFRAGDGRVAGAGGARPDGRARTPGVSNVRTAESMLFPPRRT